MFRKIKTQDRKERYKNNTMCFEALNYPPPISILDMKNDLMSKNTVFLCVYFSQVKLIILTKIQLHQIYFFCQITTFIKVHLAFVFGLQNLKSIDFTIIFQLKGLKPKNKGQTNFYECCDLTKKVYLMQVGIHFQLSMIYIVMSPALPFILLDKKPKLKISELRTSQIQ